MHMQTYTFFGEDDDSAMCWPCSFCMVCLFLL